MSDGKFDTHPEVTAGEIKTAVGKAAGVDLSGEPENDLQAVLHALDGHGLTELEAVVCLLRITMAQKGVNEGGAREWGALALRLGPDIIAAVKRLAELFG